MAFFSTAFCFNAVYTESPFLALSAGSVRAVRVRKDLLVACPFAELAAATRNVGVFLLIPLIYGWYEGRKDYGWWLAYLALVPSGLLAYMVYLWARFGDPFIFQKVQEVHWQRGFANPVAVLRDVSRRAFGELSGPFDPNVSVLPGRDLLDPLAASYNLHNLFFLAFVAPILVLGLRPLDPLMGFKRYVLVAFPLFVVLGARFKNRAVLGAWLVPSTFASLLLCALFVGWWVASARGRHARPDRTSLKQRSR